MAKPSYHYYEAHINLGNMDEVLEEGLMEVLNKINFKTTDIVTMPYEGLEQEDFHTILTTKDSNLKVLTQRVKDSVNLLIGLGYKVNRYKIESTIVDSKYEDTLGLLRMREYLTNKIRCESPHPTMKEHICVNFLTEGETCKEHGCLISTYKGEMAWITWLDDSQVNNDVYMTG